MSIRRIAAARAGADLAPHGAGAAGTPLKVRPYMAFVAVLAGLVGVGLQARPDAQETVDVSRLPLNLERIQRELRQSAIREEREGLNLRYVVEVYGQAPPFVLFGPEDNLVHGPVPYGAPTHRDMIAHVTPKEFRTTGAGAGADVGALFRWLAEKAKK